MAAKGMLSVTGGCDGSREQRSGGSKLRSKVDQSSGASTEQSQHLRVLHHIAHHEKKHKKKEKIPVEVLVKSDSPWI